MGVGAAESKKGGLRGEERLCSAVGSEGYITAAEQHLIPSPFVPSRQEPGKRRGFLRPEAPARSRLDRFSFHQTRGGTSGSSAIEKKKKKRGKKGSPVLLRLKPQESSQTSKGPGHKIAVNLI